METAVFLEAHKEIRTVESTDFAGSIHAETKSPAAYNTVSQQCVGKMFPRSKFENLSYSRFLVCYPFVLLNSLLLRSQRAQGQRSQDIAWRDFL